MLATGQMPQTPDLMRTKKLTPWKLNGPFPKGLEQAKLSSRVGTPMMPLRLLKDSIVASESF